jgi:hypothetical protein
MLPDPATGEIGGKRALAVAPAQGSHELLSPWGFTAHLVGHDDPSVDLVFPCGTWFLPPPARYRVWVEGEWQISPFSLVLIHTGQPFRGTGMTAAVPVVAAGRVTVPAGLAADPHLVLRLLHAGSYLEGSFLRWELSRRKSIREVGEGLLMPVGPAIGALWDERAQRYVALSRPFEVEARKTVAVPFQPPDGLAAVVAQIQRPTLGQKAEDLKVNVYLQQSGRRLPPGLEVAMADRIYAFWYGLKPGLAELRAASAHTVLEPVPLQLAAGMVERVVGTLKPLPFLAPGTKP